MFLRPTPSRPRSQPSGFWGRRAQTIKCKKLSGFTLIETLITLTIFAFLGALAYPYLTQWLQTARTRAAATALLAGVQQARAQAIQRNTTVYFQLTNSLNDGCSPTPTGGFWVVSQFALAGRCAEPTDTHTDYLNAGLTAADRALILAKSEQGLDTNLQVSATADTLCFSATGRLMALGADCVQAPAVLRLQAADLAANCNEAGRCFNITVSTGGEARLCDPVVTAADDPRRCYS